MRIALVREAGGFGDVLCTGGASRQLKLENPDSEIVLFLPSCFCDIGKHLFGVDSVRSLGNLSDITPVRRPRDSEMGLYKNGYLSKVDDCNFDKVVDLYCPAFFYETSTPRRLEYTRSQLFSMACGTKSIQNAFPRWVSSQESIDSCKVFLKENDLLPNKYVVVCLRGTCSCRTYPKDWSESLVSLLSNRYRVVYLDGMTPHFNVPFGVVRPQLSFDSFVEIVKNCAFAVTVDTCMLHVAKMVEKPHVGIFSSTDCLPFMTWYGTICSEGKGNFCKIPCNYYQKKGWNKNICRKNGCSRMHGNSPDRVMRCVKQVYKWF